MILLFVRKYKPSEVVCTSVTYKPIFQTFVFKIKSKKMPEEFILTENFRCQKKKGYFTLKRSQETVKT